MRWKSFFFFFCLETAFYLVGMNQCAQLGRTPQARRCLWSLVDIRAAILRPGSSDPMTRHQACLKDGTTEGLYASIARRDALQFLCRPGREGLIVTCTYLEWISFKALC